MKLRHGLVERAGDAGNGLRGVCFAEHGSEDLRDLTGGDAAKKSLQDEVVHGLLAALVARQNLRTKALAGARNTQAAEHAQLGGQVAEVAAVAIVQAGNRRVFVVAEL